MNSDLLLCSQVKVLHSGAVDYSSVATRPPQSTFQPQQAQHFVTRPPQSTIQPQQHFTTSSPRGEGHVTGPSRRVPTVHYAPAAQFWSSGPERGDAVRTGEAVRRDNPQASKPGKGICCECYVWACQLATFASGWNLGISCCFCISFLGLRGRNAIFLKRLCFLVEFFRLVAHFQSVTEQFAQTFLKRLCFLVEFFRQVAHFQSVTEKFALVLEIFSRLRNSRSHLFKISRQLFLKSARLSCCCNVCSLFLP